MADSNGAGLGDDSRFRVNRINSAQLQNNAHGGGQIQHAGAIPEDREMSHIDMVSIPNLALQPRRFSLAQGLGGGRKKSVSLPKEFDYEEDGAEDGSPTVYDKSLAYYTREALPKMDNYKNLQSMELSARPTLDELRSEAMYAKVKSNAEQFSILI
jgi:hypothetical protein